MASVGMSVNAKKDHDNYGRRERQLITTGLREEPTCPAWDDGAADLLCERLPACDCEERPAKGGKEKYFSPLIAGVLFVAKT